MVGKGVGTVAQLFLKLCLHIVWVRGTREGISLPGSIDFHLFALTTIFINPSKTAILDFVLMLSARLSCTFTNCRLRCLYVTTYFFLSD